MKSTKRRQVNKRQEIRRRGLTHEKEVKVQQDMRGRIREKSCNRLDKHGRAKTEAAIGED